MMLIGKYVKTFTEATHALPQGMHMNADYPFMLPRIVARDGKQVTLAADRTGDQATAKIKRDAGGEYVSLCQSSSFESLFGRKPTRFKFLPFKEDS